jgi:hypothetical protein
MRDIPITDITGSTVTENVGSEDAPEVVTSDEGEVTGGTIVSLGGGVMSNVRSIYERGQENGFNPAMFIFVGDSNVARGAVGCNFGRGTYELGSRSDLQPIVDYFNSSGAFCHDGVTAAVGFSAFNVLDPTWAPADKCEANVNPIECEIFLSKPSYAFIYLGVQDLETIIYDETVTSETFRVNLVRVVDLFSEKGVVPILTTFPTAEFYHAEVEGGTTTVNNVIREVARARQVPLIDLRAATFNYEMRGAEADGYHMSTPPGGATSFNGNQDLYGRTRYELLMLEVLQQLHGALS